MSRILIAGGGTAGHVVPALALADVLAGRGHEIAFCGTERGMEKSLVARAGYPFSSVRIRGFERKLGLSTVWTLGSIPLGGADAWRLLRSYRPDCVVGVGGYASGPVVAEAAVARHPGGGRRDGRPHGSDQLDPQQDGRQGLPVVPPVRT